MGNSTSRASSCFLPSVHDQHDVAAFCSQPIDEGFGHSFCYIRPTLDDSSSSSSSSSSVSHSVPHNKSSHSVARNGLIGGAPSSSDFHQPPGGMAEEGIAPKNAPETSFFRTISGASVSANTSTPHSTPSYDQFNSFSNVPCDCPAAFESTPSFCALPLQPLPRGSGPVGVGNSGPLSGPLDRGFPSSPLDRGFLSIPLERGFASGPLERGHLSGPIDFVDRSHFSAPIVGSFHRKSSIADMLRSVGRPVKRVISKTVSKTSSTLSRSRKPLAHLNEVLKAQLLASDYFNSSEVQWAQGKAGEDRVHIVLSEEHGWLFVGIYDGFNGPDAPDFLLSNLYPAIQDELQGLLWGKKEGPEPFHTAMNDQDKASRPAEKEQTRGTETSPEAKESERVGENIRLSGDHTDAKKGRGILRNYRDNSRDGAESGNCRTLQSAAGVARESCSGAEQCIPQVGKENMATCREHCAKPVPYAKVVEPTLPPKSQGQFARSVSAGELEGKGAQDPAMLIHQNEYAAGESAAVQPEYSDTDAGFDRSHRKSRGHGKARLQRKRKGNARSLLSWRLELEEERKQLAEAINRKSATEEECGMNNVVDQSAVLQALSRALEATESAFLAMADQVIDDNPELALMGSCVLVMLMKGEDVYTMNVGDSRAILAKKPDCDFLDLSSKFSKSEASCQFGPHKANNREKTGARDLLLRSELDRIIEETSVDLEALEASFNAATLRNPVMASTLDAVQLSSDHSTSVQEEVLRIRAEHPDDETSISNDRVKGTLKVTRAFGAGFLKQRNWNDALLEMFRIDYIGTAPYISCAPALCHHRLGSHDQFLVLSSDGLYQYLTNEEVVAHVEWFMERFPDGDPAQYLIEELLFRAAKKAGMDFHELLDIPQGDRRKYHDDVSVMVVSLEGRIWRSSSMK